MLGIIIYITKINKLLVQTILMSSNFVFGDFNILLDADSRKLQFLISKLWDSINEVLLAETEQSVFEI